MAVYASSDWHGCLEPALKLLDYLEPNDTLYFIGDALDRGPDGVTLMTTLLEDPRVIYLMGNHEDFFVKAAPSFWKPECDFSDIKYLWFFNGGNVTAKQLELLYDVNKQKKLWSKIKQLPLSAEYISPAGHKVILEHAGFTPGTFENRASHNALWDREHFTDQWIHEKEYENVYVVHGHTPVPYLTLEYDYTDKPPLTEEEQKMQVEWLFESKYYEPKVIRYCDKHKFDIDMGTFFTRRVALLNLDTFETIYFDEDID